MQINNVYVNMAASTRRHSYVSLLLFLLNRSDSTTGSEPDLRPTPFPKGYRICLPVSSLAAISFTISTSRLIFSGDVLPAVVDVSPVLLVPPLSYSLLPPACTLGDEETNSGPDMVKCVCNTDGDQGDIMNEPMENEQQSVTYPICANGSSQDSILCESKCNSCSTKDVQVSLILLVRRFKPYPQKQIALSLILHQG